MKISVHTVNQVQRDGLCCTTGIWAIYIVGMIYSRLVSEYSNSDTNWCTEMVYVLVYSRTPSYPGGVEPRVPDSSDLYNNDDRKYVVHHQLHMYMIQ